MYVIRSWCSLWVGQATLPNVPPFSIPTALAFTHAGPMIPRAGFMVLKRDPLISFHQQKTSWIHA